MGGASGNALFTYDASHDVKNGSGSVGDVDVLAANLTGIGGTGGDDFLSSDGEGRVNLFGRGGDDFLGSTGGGTIAGGAGNDFLSAYAAAEVLNGGPGLDTVLFVAPDAQSGPGATIDLLLPHLNTGVAAGDQLIGVEAVIGTARPDIIRGTNGADTLFGSNSGRDLPVLFPGDADIINGRAGDDALSGGDGNDRLIGGPGADALSGGAGFDTAIYSGAATGVIADLALGGRGGEALGDSYDTIEIVVGSRFGDVLRGQESGDVLVGGAGDDVLAGRAGTDRLVGGAGDDVLFGGTGGDVLFGGAGADLFAYSNADLAPEAAGGARDPLTQSINAVAVRPRDLVADFGEGDRIDLSRIDADASRAGDQAFRLDDGGAFEAGEVRQVQVGAFVRVTANLHGDAGPELDLFVRATSLLGADDFIL